MDSLYLALKMQHYGGHSAQILRLSVALLLGWRSAHFQWTFFSPHIFPFKCVKLFELE